MTDNSSEEKRSSCQVWQQVEETKIQIGWTFTFGESRKFWLSFEEANEKSPEIVLALSNALAKRDRTINELFNAFTESYSESVLANLEFLDMTAEEFPEVKRLTAEHFRRISC